MSTLQNWEKKHKEKILKELKQSGIELTIENIPEIIKKTSFEIRSQEYPNQCPYYKTEKSCHPEIPDLNCFLCACPNYISEKKEGGCRINSKFGKFAYHKNLPAGKVWDCSDCNINHSPEEVKKYLKENMQILQRLNEKQETAKI